MGISELKGYYMVNPVGPSDPKHVYMFASQIDRIPFAPVKVTDLFSFFKFFNNPKNPVLSEPFSPLVGARREALVVDVIDRNLMITRGYIERVMKAVTQQVRGNAKTWLIYAKDTKFFLLDNKLTNCFRFAEMDIVNTNKLVAPSSILQKVRPPLLEGGYRVSINSFMSALRGVRDVCLQISDKLRPAAQYALTSASKVREIIVLGINTGMATLAKVGKFGGRAGGLGVFIVVPMERLINPYSYLDDLPKGKDSYH
jgi:hypothetical protein